MAFGRWQTAAKAYWPAVDHLREIEAEKALLLAEWDSMTKQRTRTRIDFTEPAELRVRVLFKGTTDLLPLNVYVNGAPSRQVSPGEYIVAESKIPDDKLGVLEVEVR